MNVNLKLITFLMALVFALMVVLMSTIKSEASSSDIPSYTPINQTFTNNKINAKSQGEAISCEGNQCSLEVIKASPDTKANPVKDQSIVDSDYYISLSTLSFYLQNESWILTAGIFWLMGILLAFTPCVLPLTIILAGFLVGRTGEISHRIKIILACVYVLSVALSYAAAGMLVALFGVYLSAYFNNSWVVAVFSLVVALLSFQLLGFYKLVLPESLRHRVVSHFRYKPHYQYLEVSLMGLLAVFIASPCVAAPLVTVLGYVGHSGSLYLGFIALFSLGVGIGTPLIIATVYSKQVLQRFTDYQEFFQSLFGISLLAVVIWMLVGIISPEWNLLVWSIFFVFTANYLSGVSFHRYKGYAAVLWKSIVFILLAYSVALFFGFLMGNVSLKNPLYMGQFSSGNNLSTVNFNVITSIKSLESEVAKSKTMNKNVLVYFYADWCPSCREFEEAVIDNPGNSQMLNQFTLLKVDLTQPDKGSYDVARKYHVSGPPEIIFFNQDGHLLNSRVVGSVSQNAFASVITQIIMKK